MSIETLKTEINRIKSSHDLLHTTHNYLSDVKEKFEDAIKIYQNDFPQHSEEIAQLYVEMSKIFWRQGQAISAAIDLLLHGVDQFSEWQVNNRYIPRSTLFSQLTAIYLHLLNDKGFATWWSLHTVVDSPGGDNTFISRLGYPAEVVGILQSMRENSEEFTEQIICDFLNENKKYRYILAQSSNENFYPICNAYYQRLLHDLNSNNIDKGKALENLAYYLFLLIPGCVPRRNIRGDDNTHETDLVVPNHHPTSNLAVELFGRNIIVECKNWETPVGVQHVGYFLHKIHLMHASFGVMFAKQGITGNSSNDDERAARQLIRRTFHEDGTLCVVITKHDLERLRDREITFYHLLIELADEFQFGT